MDTLLKILARIYEAFGADSPRKFIFGCAVLGAISFAFIGWVAVKYQAKLQQESKPVPATGPASTTGNDSPAVTAPGNTFNYNRPPKADEPKKSAPVKEAPK
jgi:hypothetical protein